MITKYEDDLDDDDEPRNRGCPICKGSGICCRCHDDGDDCNHGCWYCDWTGKCNECHGQGWIGEDF